MSYLVTVLSAFTVFSAVSALTPLAAQTTRASGWILTADSTPVRGATVVLHRVGRVSQGPIDSTRSDQTGRFRITFRSDTSAIYLLSARHAGIEYFSPPVETNPQRPDTGIQIMVYDTSSTVPIVLEARHLVVTRPDEDGSRGVLDLMVLRNDAHRTRIAPDTGRPSWSAALPSGTIGLEVGESDVSRDAVTRRGDSVFVIAPFAPGEKQVTLQYLIPSNRRMVELPFDGQGATVNVLAEEKGVKVSGGGVTLTDSQTLQGRSFRRWTGRVRVRGVLRIELPGSRETPVRLLGGLVTAFALALGGAGWLLLARRRTVAPAAPNSLVDAIAALDAQYAGREAAAGAEEWASYQAERARLKAALEASLASGRRNQ
jgi:hypothetical protein